MNFPQSAAISIETLPMYFVYVLHSQKDGLLYIGFAEDIKARLLRHHAGEVPSTKFRRPLKLIFLEAYIIKSDALRREQYFKTTKGKTTLKLMLKDYFHTQNETRSYKTYL